MFRLDIQLKVLSLTLEPPRGSNGPPIGFSDLEFEALKQSK